MAQMLKHQAGTKALWHQRHCTKRTNGTFGTKALGTKAPWHLGTLLFLTQRCDGRAADGSQVFR